MVAFTIWVNIYWFYSLELSRTHKVFGWWCRRNWIGWVEWAKDKRFSPLYYLLYFILLIYVDLHMIRFEPLFASIASMRSVCFFFSSSSHPVRINIATFDIFFFCSVNLSECRADKHTHTFHMLKCNFLMSRRIQIQTDDMGKWIKTNTVHHPNMFDVDSKEINGNSVNLNAHVKQHWTMDAVIGYLIELNLKIECSKTKSSPRIKWECMLIWFFQMDTFVWLGLNGSQTENKPIPHIFRV